MDFYFLWISKGYVHKTEGIAILNHPPFITINGWYKLSINHQKLVVYYPSDRDSWIYLCKSLGSGDHPGLVTRSSQWPDAPMIPGQPLNGSAMAYCPPDGGKYGLADFNLQVLMPNASWYPSCIEVETKVPGQRNSYCGVGTCSHGNSWKLQAPSWGLGHPIWLGRGTHPTSFSYSPKPSVQTQSISSLM